MKGSQGGGGPKKTGLGEFLWEESDLDFEIFPYLQFIKEAHQCRLIMVPNNFLWNFLGVTSRSNSDSYFSNLQRCRPGNYIIKKRS
jgi:hypothetical protein